MPIAASGAVSFSDLRSEFVGSSAAISFSDLYRGGSNIRAKAANNNGTNLAASVPTSGTINFTNFRSQAKGFRYTYSATATDQDADTLFGDDYAVNYPKEIVINAGVTIGGVSDDALDIPAGLSGALTINNSGSIVGKGGAAGAAGGNAISCSVSGVTLNNLSGSVLAGGGGGGGTGGTGGNGSYSGQDGPSFSGQVTWWGWRNSNGFHSVKWGGATIYGGQNTPMLSSVSSGGYTYYPSTFQYSNDPWYYYSIYRTYSVSTTGGAGGAGGVGQGYNQLSSSGSAGAAGGTNSGTGGTGGTGGSGASYGTAGSSGAAGANGTVSNGSAGSSGGAAGSAIAGTSITLNNSGSVYGATA